MPSADLRIEMHCHTTYSDGVLTVPELLNRASEMELTHISITDHDCLTACFEAPLALPEGMRFIPGVEISTRWDGRCDLHILGYFIDASERSLTEALEQAVEGRSERVVKMVSLLEDAGFDISLDWFETGGYSLNRSNIARRLVEVGSATNVNDAFDTLIGRKCPYYVPKHDMESGEAVDLVHDAGGIAVIAHPAHYGVEDAIEPLFREHGLDGIECRHSEQTQEEETRLEGVARSLGMLVTGGSDYHGDPVHPENLGSCQPEIGDMEAFLEAGRARGFCL